MSRSAAPKTSAGEGEDPSRLIDAKSALLDDPARLFNSSLEGNMRRAIDIHEGEGVDQAAFKKLVRAAVARNKPAAP